MKRWQSLTLGIVISVASLAYALNGVPLDTLWGEFTRARYVFVIPAAGCLLLGLVCRGLRWQALVDRRTTAIHAFHITNVGYLFNTLLPFRLGELARIYLATQLQPAISAFTAFSTIVAERLADTLGVFVIAALAISISPVPPAVSTAAAITGVIAVIGLIVTAVLSHQRTRVHQVIDGIVARFPLLKRINPATIADRALEGITPIATPRSLAVVLGWTAAAWALTVLLDYFVMAMFYETPTLRASLLMISLGALAVALPATPGSIGSFEAFTRQGLVIAGVASLDNPESLARALACAVMIHVLDSLLYAIMGWIGLTQERIGLGRLLRSAQSLVVRSPDKPLPPDDPVITSDALAVTEKPPTLNFSDKDL